MFETYDEAVRLEGVEGGLLQPGGPINVANFLITPGPIDLQFDHTEFWIRVDAPDLFRSYTIRKWDDPYYDGSKNTVEYGSFFIQGTLVGSLDTQGHGDLQAKVVQVIEGGPFMPIPADGTRVINRLPWGPESIQVASVIPLANLSDGSSRTIRVPVNVTIVPEPAAALTWLAGLGLTAVAIRRRMHHRTSK